MGKVVHRECFGSCLVLLPGSSHTDLMRWWVAGCVQLEWLGDKLLMHRLLNR